MTTQKTSKQIMDLMDTAIEECFSAQDIKNELEGLMEALDAQEDASKRLCSAAKDLLAEAEAADELLSPDTGEMWDTHRELDEAVKAFDKTLG